MTRVALLPLGVRPFLADAVREGGGVVVDVDAADALVWTSATGGAALRDALSPRIRWVQLPWAGIEPFVDVLDHARLWTAGQGVYAEPVAEHALALMLAGLRCLKLRATATSWQPPSGQSLFHARVTLVGAGGIAQSLAALLQPFRVQLTVVRRRLEPFPHAVRTRPRADLAVAVADADVVVLACALTAATRGVIDARVLGAMKKTAWLVNVARGALVDTAALVDALGAEVIGGAALDVTDPEPLPAGHPLWSSPRCLITPHVGNTPEMAVPLLSARVRDNVRRFGAGEPLLGVVDVAAGY